MAKIIITMDFPAIPKFALTVAIPAIKQGMKGKMKGMDPKDVKVEVVD